MTEAGRGLPPLTLGATPGILWRWSHLLGAVLAEPSWAVLCAQVPLLVCPPLSDVLPRCFPYTTLNNLDFLNVKGYVAGSTNPIFESHPEWWDVLMDIDTGKVLVSTTGANGKPCCGEPKKLDEMDAELMEQVRYLVTAPRRDGRRAHGAGLPTLQPYVLYGAGLLGNGRALLRVLAARLLPGARPAAALRAQEPRARAPAGRRRRAVDHRGCNPMHPSLRPQASRLQPHVHVPRARRPAPSRRPS